MCNCWPGQCEKGYKGLRRCPVYWDDLKADMLSHPGWWLINRHIVNALWFWEYDYKEPHIRND